MTESTGNRSIPNTPNLVGQSSTSFELSRIIVGVAGGSAAGKTTLCEGVKDEMQFDSDFDISIITLDSFYKGVDKNLVNVKDHNFDSPDSLDFDLAYKVLNTLLAGKPAEIPIYDFITHSRSAESIIVMPTQVIFFEGILALHDERIRKLMHYKIFIHCDDDIRLCRRILRDVKERGREVKGILYQYNRFVKHSFDDFIRPTMSYADIIVPGSRQNQVSISFIVHHLKNISKHFGVLKQKMTNLLFFGDILYSIDNIFANHDNTQSVKFCPIIISQILEKQKDITPFRKILFPTDEDVKEQLVFQTHFLVANKPFTSKQYYKSLKHVQKLCLVSMKKAIGYHNIALDDISCLNLIDLYDPQSNKIQTQKIKEMNYKTYAIITVPYLFKKSYQILKQISKAFREFHPDVILLIVNFFSEIRFITDSNKELPNVFLLSNAFLIGRFEKFESILSQCTSLESQTVFSLGFETNRFYKKMERFISKRITKKLSN